MAQIGLFYGSTAGATEAAADLIKAAFDAYEPGIVEVHDIGSCDLDAFYDYEKLIIGVPTYNIGELQDDWFMIYEDLETLSLVGVQVALFGLGDQYGYSDTFQDAIGILGKRLRDDCGAELVGYWSTEGYDFTGSLGVENGQFMGLALDEDHQAKLTEGRVKTWVQQLIQEFQLAASPTMG